MDKFLNTILHGDRKTKLYLWSIIVLIIASIGFAALFALFVKLYWIILTVVCLVLAYFIGRSSTLEDVFDYDAQNNTKHKEAIDDMGLKEQSKQEHEKLVDDNEFKDRRPEDRTPEDRRPEDRRPEGRRPEDNKKEEMHGKKNEEKTEPKKDPLEQYDKKKLKKIMVSYKVKKKHCVVLIDLCLSERIRECPAYMWVDHTKIHFLLLEEKPRTFSVPLAAAHDISYDKGVIAKPMEEYKELQKNKVMFQVFGKLIPTYYEEGVNNQVTSKKNHYIIHPDIRLTNFSARAAFDLLDAGFDLPSKYNLSEKTGVFVREAYKQKVLWQDNVLNTEEYKARIKDVLQGMVDSNISYAEFNSNLEQLVMRQIITREYADYYVDYWSKNVKNR